MEYLPLFAALSPFSAERSFLLSGDRAILWIIAESRRDYKALVDMFPQGKCKNVKPGFAKCKNVKTGKKRAGVVRAPAKGETPASYLGNLKAPVKALLHPSTQMKMTCSIALLCL
jgi:hypothetical protein